MDLSGPHEYMRDKIWSSSLVQKRIGGVWSWGTMLIVGRGIQGRQTQEKVTVIKYLSHAAKQSERKHAKFLRPAI